MARKELQAVMSLLGSVRGAVAELKWYGKDYDAPTVSSTGEALEKAVEKFRKEAKL